MRRKSLLISALTFLLLTIQLSLAGSEVFSKTQNSHCDPVETAWVSDLTLNGFDLHWTAIPNVNSYQVDVWVNNFVVYSIITPTTTANIMLPSPLKAGDLVVYYIYTYCNNGGIGNPYRGEFPIIATEDVVMINPGGSPPTCDCPLLMFPSQQAGAIHMIYDCVCVQKYAENYEEKCPMRKGGIHAVICNSSPSSTHAPLTHFYPNPFSNQLTASFNLPQAGEVNLSILDFQGRAIRSIIKEEYFSAGPISIEIDTADLERGIYYYVFSLGEDRWFGRLVRL